LGSGISIRAGMPSMKEITDNIRDEKHFNLVRNDLINNVHGYNGDMYNIFNKVMPFINKMTKNIEDDYANPVYPFYANYEMIYYIAEHFIGDAEGKFADPPARTFMKEIFTNNFMNNGVDNDYIALVKKTLEYILYSVSFLLHKEPSCLSYLNCIRDACDDERLSRVDIFTLNHDTVLEKLLIQNGIPFTDSFGEPNGDFRRWAPDVYSRSPHKTRIFKLHGSIDWSGIKLSKDENAAGFLCKLIGKDKKSDIFKDSAGLEYKKQYEYPILLIGSINKSDKYTPWDFAELQCQFLNSLQHKSRLIVCGYGFGDMGVNSRIFSWLAISPVNKILLIHPDGTDFYKTKTGKLRESLGFYANKNKFIPLKKRIEEMSWQEIKDILWD
jgi:hypothetical protein